MDDKLQNRIDAEFDKLTEFINKLPLSYNYRNYLWMDSFCQFYDEPVKSENGKTTYGIQTEWQLQIFIEKFKKNIKKLRLKTVENWTDNLNNIEPSEAITRIDKMLHHLERKKLLAEIGGDGLNEWQKWKERYLESVRKNQQRRPTRKPQKQQKKTSYLYQGTDKDLPEFHSLMIENKLIASETSYEQFKSVFTGLPIENINPIKWHQNNATELLYFIIKLEQSGIIEHNPKRTDYQKLQACFVKPDGKEFNEAMKSLKTDIDTTLSQDKQDVIDVLVKNFE